MTPAVLTAASVLTAATPMTGARHDHGDGAAQLAGLFTGLLLSVLAVALVTYLVAARRVHRHGAWPSRRTALWAAGVVLAGTGATVSSASGQNLTGQVAGHLLLGMAAPLALVLAAPVTLALRALPAPQGRRLTGLLALPSVRLATHPVTTTLLDVGGLWLLFATPLHATLHGTVWGAAVVSAHMLLAGYLFTNAMVGVDPAPHRTSYPRRAVVLLLALAAHAILAKHLYAHPPAGVAAADAEGAGLLMYYGGDAVHVALLVVFCRRWSAADRGAARRSGLADGSARRLRRQERTRSRIVSGSSRSAVSTDGASAASTSVIT